MGLALGTGATAVTAQEARRTPMPEPVRAVDSVDLGRYAGRWHEVARLPNSFQSDCAGETTADYEVLANGQVRVVNQCRRPDGTVIRAEGRARLADRKGPTSKLKVRFAPAFLSWLPMVWGNYWVLDLTDDYSAALVGDPSRQYLWVLSRTPRLSDSTYRRMLATARRLGFDVVRLVVSSAQREAQPPAPSP